MTEDNHKEAKLFIVEDDVDLLEMLSAYFKVQGYDVTSLTRGEMALEAIRDTMPDLVVLDIRLPKMSGYEIARNIRLTRRTENLPIIFLTEKREREDKLIGLELGAVDYITKPFDIQELRLRIRNAIRRSRQSTLLNPVTGLPEGLLVEEQLEKMLQAPDWGLVLCGIRGLSRFRDRFGFVAADDVSRAVTLMITNAVQELGADDDFVGHTNSGDFIVITSADRSDKLAERCLMRLQPSIQYFYPALERQRLFERPSSERLMVEVQNLTNRDHVFASVDALYEALDAFR